MATISHQPQTSLTFEPLQANQVATATTDKEYIPSGDAIASLFFSESTSDGEAPYNYVEEPPAGVARSNLVATEHKVKIYDANAHPEFQPTLNDNGFQFGKHPTVVSKGFNDEKEIEEVYYKEIKDIILSNVPGAKDITIFDHTIRRAGPNAKRGPVNRVHIDQTKKSGPQRVFHHHPDTANELIKDRVRIINVWRTIDAPIVTSPLAYADAATVDPSDVSGVKHIYPDRTGETAAVKYNERTKFWYKSGFGADDFVLLQCFDSHEKKTQAPHSAFTHPDEKEGSRGRESIEVRVLVWG